MKTLLSLCLLTLATSAFAVQINVKCQGDEVIIAKDKQTDALKGAYICSKSLSNPIAIIKNENYDEKLDQEDSISFYISKDFTLYKSFLIKKFENFEKDLNDHFLHSGEKDTYFKIDFNELYDHEEIEEAFRKVQEQLSNSSLNKKNPHELDNVTEEVYRKRFYDPQTGRFLSEDPKGIAGRDFNWYQNVGDVGKFREMTNLYGYVRQNPLMYVDHNGMEAVLVQIGFGQCVSTSFNNAFYYSKPGKQKDIYIVDPDSGGVSTGKGCILACSGAIGIGDCRKIEPPKNKCDG